MRRILRAAMLILFGAATGCALAAGALTLLWVVRDAALATWAFLCSGFQETPLLWGMVVAGYGWMMLLGLAGVFVLLRRTPADQAQAPYAAPRAPWARRQ